MGYSPGRKGGRWSKTCRLVRSSGGDSCLDSCELSRRGWDQHRWWRGMRRDELRILLPSQMGLEALSPRIYARSNAGETIHRYASTSTSSISTLPRTPARSISFIDDRSPQVVILKEKGSLMSRRRGRTEGSKTKKRKKKGDCLIFWFIQILSRQEPKQTSKQTTGNSLRFTCSHDSSTAHLLWVFVDL